MIVATLRFTIHPENKADAIAVLTALCSQSEVLQGCQFCRFYNNIGLADHDDEILLIERWDTKASIEKHILSPIFKQLIEIMDLATAPPELMFHKVSATAGVEMVEELCQNKLESFDGECFQ